MKPEFEPQRPFLTLDSKSEPEAFLTLNTKFKLEAFLTLKPEYELQRERRPFEPCNHSLSHRGLFDLYTLILSQGGLFNL